MSTSSPHRFAPFGAFDRAIERRLGADMRLIYGFAAPILLVVGVIILLALGPSPWLVAAVLIVELVALGVIVAGFVEMLNEPADDE